MTSLAGHFYFITKSQFCKVPLDSLEEWKFQECSKSGSFMDLLPKVAIFILSLILPGSCNIQLSRLVQWVSPCRSKR